MWSKVGGGFALATHGEGCRRTGGKSPENAGERDAPGASHQANGQVTRKTQAGNEDNHHPRRTWIEGVEGTHCAVGNEGKDDPREGKEL